MSTTAASDTLQLIGQLLQDDPSRYRDVIDELNDHRIEPPSWGFSVYNAESVQSMQENLGTLAIIATFLAAVQAQVITYSIQSNSTKLEVAVNAFFFVGLLLDIFGGCTAYAVAVQLQHIHSVLIRRSLSVSKIALALADYRVLPNADLSGTEVVKELPSVARHVRALEILFLTSLTDKSAWEPSLSKVRQCQRVLYKITRALENVHQDDRLRNQVYIDLQVYRYTASELNKWRSKLTVADASITIIQSLVFSGVLCLLVGLLCYVEEAQPKGVWITFFASLGTIIGLFVWLFLSSLRS